MIKRFLYQITPTSIWHSLQKIKSKTHLVRTVPKQTKPRDSFDSVLSCFVAYNEFGGYCIPNSSVHRPAVQRVLAGDVWERDTIEYLTSHFGDGDIIHAGTYFGDFLPALSAACPAGSKVWAFEPNPENFRCASITALINNLTNIELANAGLGASEGTVMMATTDTSGRSLGGASRVVSATSESIEEQTETIRIVSIDEIVPEVRHVALIQLDVEGYEKEALSGALKTINRCRPILILETLPEDSWFSDSVLRLGYTVTGKTDANTILSCEHYG